ncbi:MAG: ankyrin repeat domain-containing protein [Vicinamibacterales bacterium]
MQTDPRAQHLDLERALAAGDLAGIRVVFAGARDFPDVADPLTGAPLLPLALRQAPASLVYVLLDLGADVNVLDANRRAALHCAITREGPERYDLLAALLMHGAAPDQPDGDGQTPLHVAAARDDAHAIEILLTHGADAAGHPATPETPLALAVRMGHHAAAAALERSRDDAP